jgi:hypothetical protein
MRRLPVLIFAAALAIWGLASIPDRGANDKIAHQREELARRPLRTFPALTQKAGTSAVRAPRFDRALASR